jgi:hypothetical protein
MSIQLLASLNGKKKRVATFFSSSKAWIACARMVPFGRAGFFTAAFDEQTLCRQAGIERLCSG